MKVDVAAAAAVVLGLSKSGREGKESLDLS